MTYAKLEIKRLSKLLTKEFPDNYISVGYKLRTNLVGNKAECEEFSVYIADTIIFRHSANHTSAASPDFSTIVELVTYVKKSIEEYRISEQEITEVDFEEGYEDKVLNQLNGEL
jgi:hypothetical protein